MEEEFEATKGVVRICK